MEASLRRASKSTCVEGCQLSFIREVKGGVQPKWTLTTSSAAKKAMVKYAIQDFRAHHRVKRKPNARQQVALWRSR